MEYINHFTLNTGHNRKSYPTEIDKISFSRFLPIVEEIIEKGEECKFIIEDTYLHIIMEDDQYVATLYSEFNGQNLPVFLSLATSNPGKRLDIENVMKEFRKFTDTVKSFMIPNPPVIVDVLLPAVQIRPDILSMTGDLSRCLAWAILDPGRIDGAL